MLTEDLLAKVGASVGAVELFTAPKPSSEQLTEIRLCLSEILYEYAITWTPAEYLGFYAVNKIARTIQGLHPTNYNELVFMMLYHSTMVFIDPEVKDSMRWVRDCGEYNSVANRNSWVSACNHVQKLISRSVVDTVST